VRPACLAIALGFLCLVLESPLVPQPTLVQQMELRLLGWHARLRGPRPAPANISIVAIDETSLELVGRWPWPRTRTAEIIQRLAEGGARVIALREAHAPRRRGSRASRRPSPRRLNPRTASMMASPGIVVM
jgi:CHASE2 domain